MKMLLILLALVLSSCASAPPTLSPAGRAAFHATRVVKGLDLLRDFAIDAEAQTPKVLSTNTTRQVVLYHRSAVRTIGAVPDGWREVVVTGLDELKLKLSGEERARLQPYINLVQTVIEEVIR